MKKVIYTIVISVFIFGFGKGYFEYKRYKKSQIEKNKAEAEKDNRRQMLKSEINNIRDTISKKNIDYSEFTHEGYLLINAKVEEGTQFNFRSKNLDIHKTDGVINFYFENKKIVKIKLNYYIQNKLAIIIDDVGRTEKTAYEFLKIREPLNFAILPFLPKTKQSGDILREAGYLTMLHMPMEAIPRNYMVKGLNDNTKGLVRVNMSENEIRDKFQSALNSVGYVSGFNNHMGSKFTSNEEKMTYALKMAKEKQMFYIDSVTQNSSKGYKIAKKMGIKTKKRQVFIDNKKEVPYIKNQIKKATDLAIKDHEVIAIGHYHKETAQAIKEMLPYIQENDVELVYVDELLN